MRAGFDRTIYMDGLQHECGLAALYHLPDAEGSPLVPDRDPQQTSSLIPRMLLDLQNRGQLAAGFSSFQTRRDHLLETYRAIGPVNEAFRVSHPDQCASIMQEFAGHAAIGHVRYATCGPNSRAYAQPFERRHGCKWKWFTFAFNGQIANVNDLRREILSREHYHLTREGDTEVLMHYLAQELHPDDPPDLIEVFRRLAARLDGAYNIVLLNAMGDMVVFRDPLGIRPMCFAQQGPLFAAASESVALANLGFRDIRSLPPGDMILIQNGQLRQVTCTSSTRSAHCFFEWIYFANVASTLDDRSVYLSRSALGKELAQAERHRQQVPLDEDTIVVPVPDTGKAAADAMAHELGVPSREGLMRNRSVGRTFIEGANRAERVRLKFTPLREVMADKRVLLVEDSLVRSTTLKTLLGYLRERGGAREIHVRIACPPIIAPCFYGIDMSTVSELFAPRYLHGLEPTEAELARMAADLGADSVYYLPVGALARCIGLPAEQLCLACVTGSYPTAKGTALYQQELAQPTPLGERVVDTRTPTRNLISIPVTRGS